MIYIKVIYFNVPLIEGFTKHGENSMTIRYCRDCVNFEERRDIDGVVLCARKIGPYASCDEFELREKDLPDGNKLYNRFCVECANFEFVNEIPICAKSHTPNVACVGFSSRFEKLNGIRWDNHAKTALLIHVANGHNNAKDVPDYLIKIGRKIKW